jgi:hypothetical protein
VAQCFNRGSWGLLGDQRRQDTSDGEATGYLVQEL